MSNTRKVKPEDKSTTVVTDFDVLIAEANFEPYRFTLGGKERELPHLRTLKMPDLEGMENDFDAKFPEIAGEELAALVLDLPVHAFEAFTESWFAHCGLNLGELLASVRS